MSSKVITTVYRNLLHYGKKFDSNKNAKLLFYRRNIVNTSSSSSSSSSALIADYYNGILDKILTAGTMLYRPLGSSSSSSSSSSSGGSSSSNSSNDNSSSSSVDGSDSLAQVIRNEFKSPSTLGKYKHINISYIHKHY